MSEMKLAGFLLSLGSLLLVATIGFEWKIGWIGAERPPEELPQFLQDHWDSMRLISVWQALGQFLFTLAGLLLLKHARGLRNVLWGTVSVCGVLVVAAFLLTFGSYGPLLENRTAAPELFDAMRGAIRALYDVGINGILLSFTVAFLWDLFAPTEPIRRTTGWIALGVLVLSLAAGPLAGLSPKVVGAVVFLVPPGIGCSYWRNAPVPRSTH